MSGVISFAKGKDADRKWFCAGWGFRGFLDHLLESYPGDPVLRRTVEQGKHLNGLHLAIVTEGNPELETKLLDAIEAVATEVVEGKHRVRVEGRELGEDDQSMYREAVSELLEIVRRERSD